MTDLSNQVTLDRLAAAFGFQSAEHVGDYVRKLVESRVAEEAFSAALKIMLAPMGADGEAVPDTWHIYLFASDIKVDGASVSFSYLSPVANGEKEMVAATEALQAHIASIESGVELLNAVFDPKLMPVPCNRVWVESSVAQMAAYGVQQYVRNTVTNVVRPVGVPFAPLVIEKAAEPVAVVETEGKSTVVPMTPRKR